ncbi:hypothetical protein [Myceligenerans crystallogenes]|uniref:Uncharacterized protein n=1 Tax=Myceligenerans crystallogenes TaxID=316335 RepID=A0ABP4ZSQ4_9MICO
MEWWESFVGDIGFGDLEPFLGELGPDELGGILRIAAAAVGIYVTYKVVRWLVGAADGVIGFVRTKIRERAWRDPGQLSTFVSLVLLVVAYGLFPGEQVDPADQASRLVTDLLGTIAPAAILTQTIVLGVSWLLLAWLSGVRGPGLRGPFVAVIGGTAFLALMFVLSVVPFALTGGNARVLGDLNAYVFGGLLVLGVPAALALDRILRKRGAQARSLVYGVIALVLLTVVLALPTAWIYASTASEPSVPGLLGAVLPIASYIFLFLCFGFRLSLDGHIEESGAPPVVGHLIDLCGAVTASAISLTGHPALEVVLGTVPAIVVGILPGLAVAAMIAAVHLRGARDTPRLRTSIAVAVGLGLLVVPLRELLLAADLAAVLPLG